MLCHRHALLRIPLSVPAFVRWTTRQASGGSGSSIRLHRESNDGGMKWFLAVMPVAAVGLGCWQVSRRSWKLALIAELESKTTADPIDLPTDVDALRDLEYRRVRCRGHFDFSTKQMFLTPRSLVPLDQSKSEHQGGGLISAGQPDTIGSWVVTPFTLDDGRRILVDRGWLPRSRASAYAQSKLRPQLQQESSKEVELVGVVRASESRPPFGSKNDAASDHWQYRDIDGMAERLGTEPVFLDADRSLVNQIDGAIPGQTRVNLRNEHASYIVTWFGLAIASAALWLHKYGPRRRSGIAF